MALRKILTVGNPSLNKVCRPVTAFDDRLAVLIDDMKETVANASGVGLAAPQVGILRRIVVVDMGEEIIELVNPEIVEQSGEQDGPEGCLSVPNCFGMVIRPNCVKISAQDRHGVRHTYEGEGLIARCFCHELEHLDGHLYTERAYKMLTEEEYDELLSQEARE